MNENENINLNTIESELATAENFLSSHPVLSFSPGDLKREGKTVDDYLQNFSEAERAFYLDYYSEEI